jgi:hypothetical protein
MISSGDRRLVDRRAEPTPAPSGPGRVFIATGAARESGGPVRAILFPRAVAALPDTIPLNQAAPVDPTDAHRATVRRFGRSHRS